MSRVIRLERQLAEAVEHISQPQPEETATMKQTIPTSNSVTAPSSSTAVAGDNEEVQVQV